MKSEALQHSGRKSRPAFRHCCALLGLLGVACGGAPSPCASYGGCPSSQECLANTCVPRGGEPVTPSTLRSALEPVRWHVVSGALSGADSAEQQQSGVYFGGDGARESLLLDYDLPAISPQRLERAFLIMTPLPDAPQGTQPADISAWRIIEDWTHPDPLHTPEATRPSARGIASAPLPLRIDVTELVRRWLENPSSSYGLVLKSSSTEGHPQIFATGVGGGHSPVLELYHAAVAAEDAVAPKGAAPKTATPKAATPKDEKSKHAKPKADAAKDAKSKAAKPKAPKDAKPKPGAATDVTPKASREEPDLTRIGRGGNP